MKYTVMVNGRAFYKTNRLDAAEVCASLHGGKIKPNY